MLSAMHSHFEAAVAAGGGWAALALPSAQEVTPPPAPSLSSASTVFVSDDGVAKGVRLGG